MIEIRIQNVDEFNLEEFELKKWVTEERRKKCLRLKSIRAKKAALAVEYLLNTGLKQWQKQGKLPHSFQDYSTPISYQKNQYGAPILPESGIWFNWSHSGSYAVCVIGDQPVGVDLQERKKYKQLIAKRYFPESVVKQLERLCGPDQEQLFFQYWTLWEACLKARGTGFYEKCHPLPLVDFKIERILPSTGQVVVHKTEYWQYQFMAQIPGYELCVVTSEKRKNTL